MPRGLYGRLGETGFAVGQGYGSAVADAVSSAEENFLGTYFTREKVLLRRAHIRALEAFVICNPSVYPVWPHLLCFHGWELLSEVPNSGNGF